MQVIQVKERTHDILDAYIRRGDFPALVVRNFDLLHIPDTESCARELRPDFAPPFVFVRLVSIRVPVEFVDEETREIDLNRVCGSERDDGADFRVKWWIVRRRLFAVRLLRQLHLTRSVGKGYGQPASWWPPKLTGKSQTGKRGKQKCGKQKHGKHKNEEGAIW